MSIKLSQINEFSKIIEKICEIFIYYLVFKF